MVGVEVDMVVVDSVHAMEIYQRIFEVEVVEVTNFPQGQNEAVFTIYGVRFHLLDENPEFQLIAPKEGQSQPMWLNVMVEDIVKTYDSAIAAGCESIQSVVKLDDYGVSNAMFKDPFGYVWLLHEMHQVVDFEDRVKLWEEKIGDQSSIDNGENG